MTGVEHIHAEKATMESGGFVSRTVREHITRHGVEFPGTTEV